jgi:tetratricopeptide (TPR) repeat protein
MGRDQFAAIDAVGAEEINLADELRDAIADGDLGPLVELLAALGMLWTMRGEHARLFALAGAIAEAIGGWTPPPELEDAARAAMVITLSNTMVTVDEHSGPIRALLARLGPGDSRIAGVVRVLLAHDPDGADGFEARLEQLVQESDAAVAGPAGQWLSHVRENRGDPAGAVQAAERALARADDEAGPWSEAMLHTQLAQLTMQLGDRESAVAHARAALPVMHRLGATDDEVQLRALLGLCAIAEGDLAEAEAELQRIDRVDDGEVFGGIAVRQIGAAELALARGDRAGGLRA